MVSNSNKNSTITSLLFTSDGSSIEHHSDPPLNIHGPSTKKGGNKKVDVTACVELSLENGVKKVACDGQAMDTGSL